MIKKIILYTPLVLSLALLMVVLVDWCIGWTNLSDSMLLRVMLLINISLSMGITVVTILTPVLCRPLLLTIDLVQTVLGGGYIVYFVYDLCFPQQLCFGNLFPLFLMCVAMSSLIHTLAISVYLSANVRSGEYEAHRLPDLDELSPAGRRSASRKITPDEPRYTHVCKQPKTNVKAKVGENVKKASTDVHGPAPASLEHTMIPSDEKTQTVMIRAGASRNDFRDIQVDWEDTSGASTATMPIVLPDRSHRSEMAGDSMDKTAAFTPADLQNKQNSEHSS